MLEKNLIISLKSKRFILCILFVLFLILSLDVQNINTFDVIFLLESMLSFVGVILFIDIPIREKQINFYDIYSLTAYNKRIDFYIKVLANLLLSIFLFVLALILINFKLMLFSYKINNFNILIGLIIYLGTTLFLGSISMLFSKITNGLKASIIIIFFIYWFFCLYFKSNIVINPFIASLNAQIDKIILSKIILIALSLLFILLAGFIKPKKLHLNIQTLELFKFNYKLLLNIKIYICILISLMLPLFLNIKNWNTHDFKVLFEVYMPLISLFLFCDLAKIDQKNKCVDILEMNSTKNYKILSLRIFIEIINLILLMVLSYFYISIFNKNIMEINIFILMYVFIANALLIGSITLLISIITNKEYIGIISGFFYWIFGQLLGLSNIFALTNYSSYSLDSFSYNKSKIMCLVLSIIIIFSSLLFHNKKIKINFKKDNGNYNKKF